MATLEQLVQKMNDDIMSFCSVHLYGNDTTGFYDPSTQCAIYFDKKDPGNGSKAKVFRAILAGTGDPAVNDFIWAWGNKNLPKILQDEATPLLRFGQTYQLPEFIEPALFIDAKTPVGLAVAKLSRMKGDRLKGGPDTEVVMEKGALHSRFSCPEMYALITNVLKSKMSSMLPMRGTSLVAYVFICDDTLVKY